MFAFSIVFLRVGLFVHSQSAFKYLICLVAMKLKILSNLFGLIQKSIAVLLDHFQMDILMVLRLDQDLGVPLSFVVTIGQLCKVLLLLFAVEMANG